MLPMLGTGDAKDKCKEAKRPDRKERDVCSLEDKGRIRRVAAGTLENKKRSVLDDDGGDGEV